MSNFPEQYFISMRPKFVRLRGAAQGEEGGSSSVAKNSSTHSSEIVSQQHTSFTGAPVVCQVQLSATDERMNGKTEWKTERMNEPTEQTNGSTHYTPHSTPHRTPCPLSQ